MANTSPNQEPKIAIVVVAYNAASTLRQVLDRIPDDFHDRISQVYMCDDASTDETYLIGLGYNELNPGFPMTVIQRPDNLGYGGNQKAAYQQAIEDGMDIVVLLHGDGQYAPECLPDIVAPFTDGADAVFGSRMMVPGAARKGGMPLYKYVGNKILTRFENAVLGTDLSEFHSGYRAYSVRALERIDFQSNSDGFDFDTEIIIRFVEAGLTIQEIPIPTYYGDEICRVNGMAYAWDVSWDVLSWRMNKMGLGRGRFDAEPSEYEWKDDGDSSHAAVVKLLGTAPGVEVLDLGCSGGELARRLRRDGHRVTGVDIAPVGHVKDNCSEFLQFDLDESGAVLPFDDEQFDVVVMADVLEHLRVPSERLADAARVVRRDGRMIISVPNFGHWYPRLRVGAGLFDYDVRGILDAGHLRFFTRRSFKRLLKEADLEVIKFETTGITGLPESGVGSIIRRFERLGRAVWPTLFGYQLVALVRPLPSTTPPPLRSN